jgi:hypothetical protein
MSNESTSGIGVSKTYGPQGLHANGVVKTEGVSNEIVVELDTSVSDLRATYEFALPDFALVTNITQEVEEAFVALSDYDVKIGTGGTGITTDGDLTSTGISEVALTGMDPASTGANNTDNLIITPDATAIASATGKARIVVTYKKV